MPRRLGKKLDAGTISTVKGNERISLTPPFQLTVDKKAMEAGLASMTSNVKSRLEVKTKRSAYPSGGRVARC